MTQPDGDETAVVVRGPWTPGPELTRAGDEPVTAVATPVPGTDEEEEKEALTRIAARVAAAAAYQTARGHAVLARRAYDAATHGAAREQIRNARAIGDQLALAEWVDRLGALKAGRRQRIKDLPAAIRAAAFAGLCALAGLVAVLILLGGLVAASPIGSWSSYWGFWAAVWDVLATIAALTLWAAALVPLAWLRQAYHAGRDAGPPPVWMLTAAQRRDEDGEPITPSIVVAALRDLGLPRLRKAIDGMGDAGAAMLGLITLAGCGVEVDVMLPLGVSTLEIQNKRRKLAENLGRHEHELHITIPKAARTVRLWIADSGALDEPIGPSPLVVDPEITADMYTGRAPWGQDLRGDAVLMKLLQCHLLITGLSNQGKALALDTPIPTPTGWVTMGEIRVGDRVFGIDGKPCNVIGAYDVMHGRPCYEVEFSDGTVIVADAEHLWFTETAVSRRSDRAQRGRRAQLASRGTDQQWKREMASTKTTAEIAATVRHKTSARDEANHSIPVASPLKLPKRNLPLDPYVLGYWLGDGRCDSPRISCGTEDLAHLTTEIERAGYYYRASGGRTCWMVSFHPIRDGSESFSSSTSVLRELGILNNKHIPTSYLRASEKQRRALLAGLMDSDGTIGEDGVAQIGVCDKRLADDAAELIQSLGFKVKRQIKRVRGRTEERSDFHRVLFSPHQQIFRIKRKADRVKIGEQRLKSARRYIVAVHPVQSVPVRCITVDSPDRLYLASKAFIATHNTAALRALALWLAFDPTVEFRIGDLKGAGDWRMFDGIATVLVQGPADEHVYAVTEMVEEAVAEMKRRLVALEQSGATDGVTRDMARSGQGFHPIIVIVDEAQVAFMCPKKDELGRYYGGTKATSRYFMGARELNNQGRAVNVLFWQGTQDPTDENLPKIVREGAHIRASLVVGTESQARMALGDKAIDGGAAPNKLRQGLDKGTLVVAGEGVPLPPNQPAITVRTHFIDGKDGALVAERAKRHRARTATRDLAPERDELADIGACMRGEKRVRTQEMLHRLGELDSYYRGWTFQRLAEALGNYGLEAGKSDGLKVVRAEDVQLALTERDENGREEDRDADEDSGSSP